MKKSQTLPPIVPLLFLFCVCTCDAIKQQIAPPTHQDVAEAISTYAIFFLFPLIYGFLFVVNLIDQKIERIAPRLPWLSTGTTILFSGALLFKVYFIPEIDGMDYMIPVAMWCMIGATAMIIPMSLWRRRIEKKENAEPRAAGYSMNRGGSSQP